MISYFFASSARDVPWSFGSGEETKMPPFEKSVAVPRWKIRIRETSARVSCRSRSTPTTPMTRPPSFTGTARLVMNFSSAGFPV